MDVYTIGFTRKSAAEFFGLLRSAGVRRLVDVRLNNLSQLAGFTKRDDLAFFVKELCGAEYVHEPRLAPTQERRPGADCLRGSRLYHGCGSVQVGMLTPGIRPNRVPYGGCGVSPAGDSRAKKMMTKFGLNRLKNLLGLSGGKSCACSRVHPLEVAYAEYC